MVAEREMRVLFPEEPGVYRQQLWEMTCLADREFVPPLSSRASTTQSNLSAVESTGVPAEYFEALMAQSLIIALDDAGVLGYMSFVPQREMKLHGQSFSADYLSTAIVAPEGRNRGVCRAMYSVLTGRGNDVITRTWSTNYAHIHLLESLGFSELERLKNDRGLGIDTVYFLLKQR